MSGPCSEIVQLVPRVDPWGGVSGHALELGRALAERAGLPSRFIAGESAAADHREGPSPRISERRADALAELLAEGNGSPLLVHYANYGYAHRGCPRWLVDGLASWRQAAPGGRLVTIFHELYATGLPWQSSFWLSPLQRRLAARLGQLSDRVVTSLELYGRILGSWLPPESVTTLPVFSTVGESDQPAPLAVRAQRMAVFGSAGVRSRAYSELGPALERACRVLGIEEVVDIGPGAVSPAELGGIPVQACGRLPAAEVSALLADCRAGFVGYPRAFLGKSTVFAAYCAHGLLPVSSSTQGETGTVAADGWWDPRKSPEPRDSQALANRAHAWYQQHSLPRHVELYTELLQ